MTTELLLAPETRTWDHARDALIGSLTDLVEERVREVVVSVPESGQRIVAAPIGGGQIRLAAAGNDSLVGGDRLTVRDERAVIAVGFSVSSASWGSFYWDWSAPVDASLVASGVIRTMRDIYKVEPSGIELTVTL